MHNRKHSNFGALKNYRNCPTFEQFGFPIQKYFQMMQLDRQTALTLNKARGYKTFLMLNSAERGILNAN